MSDCRSPRQTIKPAMIGVLQVEFETATQIGHGELTANLESPTDTARPLPSSAKIEA